MFSTPKESQRGAQPAEKKCQSTTGRRGNGGTLTHATTRRSSSRISRESQCTEHGVLQVPVPWAERNGRFTMELERHVCMWLKAASIKEVGFMFDLSWDEVAGIQERAVKRGLAKRQKVTPKNIGVDETSFQKHHEYVTVILDKDRNTILDVFRTGKPTPSAHGSRRRKRPILRDLRAFRLTCGIHSSRRSGTTSITGRRS